MINRDERQRFIREWLLRTFGPLNATSTERYKRFLEEAIELVQTGLPIGETIKIVSYVYSKPVGEVKQEIGGVSLALLALCESLNISAEDTESDELNRIIFTIPEVFQKKHNLKVEAGIAQPIIKG